MFEIAPSKTYKDLKSQKTGKVMIISNTSSSNGVTGYSDLNANNPANIITFSDTTDSDLTFFYQKEEFIGYAHLQAMKPKFEGLNKDNSEFIITACRAAIRGKYNYGSKFNRETANKTSIALPITDSGEPDFAYMENYIQYVQATYISKLKEKYAKKEQIYSELAS